jgi:hypothetical protein
MAGERTLDAAKTSGPMKTTNGRNAERGKA